MAEVSPGCRCANRTAEGNGNSALEVRPVETRRERELFIRLPDRLYSGVKSYVPPLLIERRETIDTRKNPYFEHARARFWLAWRDGRPVGRISAQIDELDLERSEANVGHFGFLDAEDDQLVFRRLFDAAENWLRVEGMAAATGPFNLSINQECGTLIEGFDTRPVMLLGYDPPYADTHIQASGYRKARDLLCYDYDVEATPAIISERYLRRGKMSERLKVRTLNPAEYHNEMRRLLTVFNESWADNWGFVPFTKKEMEAIGKHMKPILDPRLVIIAELDGEVISMLVCLPNLNEVIADLNGRLLPFGWAKLLWRLKARHPKSARVLLFGLRPQYRRTLAGSAAVMRILETLRQNGKKVGFKHAELSWVLEDNTMMRRVARSVGARHYKTYRIYQRCFQ